MKTKFVPKVGAIESVRFSDLEVGQGFRLHPRSDVFIKTDGNEENCVDTCGWRTCYVKPGTLTIPTDLELREI